MGADTVNFYELKAGFAIVNLSAKIFFCNIETNFFEKKLKQKKIDIIRAAERRFNKFGLKKTALDEIARDLRIGKSTLYHYFESKESLYIETINHQKREMLSEIEMILNNETNSPYVKLGQYLQSKLSAGERFPLIHELVTHIISEELPDESIKKIYKELMLEEEKLLALFLGSVATDGSIVSDKELAIFLVSGGYLLKTVSISKYDDTQPAMKDEYYKKLTRSLIEYVFNAIGYQPEIKASGES